MNVENRKLLLLGLLRIQEMHGYQLNQFLEEHLDFLTSLKPSTAYYTLEKMAQEGLVETRTEQAGNRPTRQVYGITAAGEAKFQRLLRRNLARYHPTESADDIGIGFLVDLPEDEARSLLDQKRVAIQSRLHRMEEVAERMDPDDVMHLSVARILRQLQSDLAWLDQVEAWLDRHPQGSTAGPGT